MKNRNTGIIILAAGDSSRLGQPKQLLNYKGNPLLQIAMDAAVRSSAAFKVLILGANHQQIKVDLDINNMEILVNENWSNGMASTLQVGLNELMQQAAIEQVVILLCDQPFVDEKLIDQLITVQSSSQKGIVASQYGKVTGVPVLFTKKYFPQIMKLKGQEGAKKILAENQDDLAIVDFPLGHIDIDTIEDYEMLKSFK